MRPCGRPGASRAGSACRATSPSPTGTRCSRPWPRADRIIHGYSPGADCAVDAVVPRRPRRRHRAHAGSGRERRPRYDHRPRSPRAARAGGAARRAGTPARPCGCSSGILAAHPFTATITGDESLRRRPMRRVIEPLEPDGRPHRRRRTGGPRSPSREAPCGHRLHAPRCRAPRSRARCCWPVCRRMARPRCGSGRDTRSYGAWRCARSAPRSAASTGERLGRRETSGCTASKPTVPGDLSSAAFWAVLRQRCPAPISSCRTSA